MSLSQLPFQIALTAARASAWAAALLWAIVMPLPSFGAEVADTKHAGNGESAAPASTNVSYVLGPNDVIRVVVFREPDLTMETRIDQDGSVTLGLIETVKLGGLTINSANVRLKELYEQGRFLRSPTVSVTLLQTGRTNVAPVVKKTISVAGQVKKPGSIELPEGQKIDLVQAIALAGDFTGIAKKTEVSVKRTVNGVPRVFIEDVEAMIRDAKAKSFEVLPGDVIFVKEKFF